MDILDYFWTFYLNHLSPLWGYFLEKQPELINSTQCFGPVKVQEIHPWQPLHK